MEHIKIVINWAAYMRTLGGSRVNDLDFSNAFFLSVNLQRRLYYFYFHTYVYITCHNNLTF